MNDIEVRFPGLLDAELNESERLCPLAASLTLNLYGSSEATITLPEDAPYIRIHDWVSLYTQNGFAGIFRVTNISRNFKRNLELTLLHGIDILSDSVWAEQDKFTGTMEEFLTKALNFQTHLVNGVKPWVLGTCEDYSTTFTDKEMNYDRLSTLLEGLIEEGGDYYYEYNMSTFPWTLNVRRKSSVVWSEFRLSRNVTTANVTYNDADLCTRLIVSVNNKTTEERGDYTVPSETVYPDQSAHGLIPDSAKVPGSTAEVTSNETTIKTYDSESGQRNWGIVVKTADIDLAEIRQTWPSVDAWAANFMGLRSQPSVQIQIDGEELAQLSGDNWDELALGRNCRVCLPTYSPGYFNERVVSVTYPDLFSRPSHVTVSLANALPRFSESITRIADKADSAASSARSAGRYAASAEELTKWSQIVEYYGEALDGTGVMTLYRSGIEMDAATGLKIYSLSQGVQSLYSGISVNTEGIESLVTKTGVNNLGQSETLYSKITQNATQIGLRVTSEQLTQTLSGYLLISNFSTELGTTLTNGTQELAAKITTLINTQEGTSKVKIQADQIELDGTTIIHLLEGGAVSVYSVDADEVWATDLIFHDGDDSIDTSFYTTTIGNKTNPQSITFLGSSSETQAETITYADFPHYHEVSFDNTTGKITIGGVTATAPDPFDLTRTTWYQNQISAAEVTGRESVTVSSFTWNQINVSDNPNKPHGKYYSISGQIQLGYQTGVDGQDNPIYTNIGNPIGTGPQEITGVYDAGWTVGDIAGYTRGYGIGQQDVCAGSGSVTATWDSDDHIYNLSSSIDIMSSSADSADVLFLASASGTLTPTDAINYGKDSVTLGEFTWSEYTQQNPSLPPNRTVSINVLGRATAINPKRLNLYLTNSGNWSPEHKQAVYLRAGNASGTQFAAVTLDATSEYYLGKSSVLFTDSGWSNGQRTIGISRRTDASGTANDESSTMNISVPNFSIYSAYNSGTGLLTFSASAAAKDGTATVATGTGSSDYTLSSTALTLKSNAFVYDANSTYSGYLPIVYNSGGVFKVGNTSTISANVTQYNQRVVLGQPSATIVWNSNTHKYDYHTDAAVSFGSTNVLTRTNSGHVLNPTEAIEYGKTLAPAASAVDSVKKDGTAEFSTNYKTVYIPVSAYDASNNVLWSSTIGTRSTYVSADISDSYTAGQNSVEISTATLSNLVYNSSARSATAVLTVSLTNGKSKTYSDRVDVSTPYQAGLDGRSAVNTQSFRIKLTDYSGFEIDKTYAVNTKAIYDKGVEDATPPSEYPYQAKVETSRAGTGGSVNLRASSSTSASILTAIPNGATINTKVELGTTPNESGAWYNADWVEVQYGNYTGYVQSQFVLNTVKYWQTQPKYIYGVYSDGFTPPVEVGVKVPGRTGLVIFNLMNNKSAAMAQQGGLYEQDITGTPTNVYSSSWRAIGKTCYVCYSDGTTRSYTIEDENA